MRTLFLAGALSLISSLALAAPVDWAIDGSHSRVGFTVSHMVISEVDGNFRDVKGSVKLDEADLTKSSVEITIPVASVNTDNADRDKHLKSADFFDAEKHPNITFKSTKIKKAGKAFKLTGDLTIRGITKSVTLDATLSNAVQNPWGKSVRGVKVSGKIKRQDFGLNWNKSLDKGGVVVGDEVTLNVKLELNK
ncbi:MAG: YceI family protein [Polyangiaceae bacterium]|nr:YceI family protein [Polyangiaceae bacterium]